MVDAMANFPALALETHLQNPLTGCARIECPSPTRCAGDSAEQPSIAPDPLRELMVGDLIGPSNTRHSVARHEQLTMRISALHHRDQTHRRGADPLRMQVSWETNFADTAANAVDSASFFNVAAEFAPLVTASPDPLPRSQPRMTRSLHSVSIEEVKCQPCNPRAGQDLAASRTASRSTGPGDG
jgi:hypothetical protein